MHASPSCILRLTADSHTTGSSRSCVLERLNPCLEYPVDWRLVEKGDDEEMAVSPTFRFVGTMTTARSQQRELSPALYNRFNIIHMDPLPEKDGEDEFAAELKTMARTLLGELASTKAVQESIARLCWTFWNPSDPFWSNLRNPKEVAQVLTFRSLFRLLDSVYRLWCAGVGQPGRRRRQDRAKREPWQVHPPDALRLWRWCRVRRAVRGVHGPNLGAFAHARRAGLVLCDRAHGA